MIGCVCREERKSERKGERLFLISVHRVKFSKRSMFGLYYLNKRISRLCVYWKRRLLLVVAPIRKFWFAVGRKVPIVLQWHFSRREKFNHRQQTHCTGETSILFSSRQSKQRSGFYHILCYYKARLIAQVKCIRAIEKIQFYWPCV
jgi:hypothetical protein